MKRRRLWACAGGITVMVVYLSLAFLYNALPQKTIYQLTECPIPGDGQKVLVFSPHPDDESIAVGGYLFSSREGGAEVQVILATDGNRRGLREKRYQEFREATAQLQILPSDLCFWGYPDGRLSDHFDEAEAQAESAIAQLQPEYVIYPHPEDRHPDHAVLGRAVERALASKVYSGQNIKAYAYLVHYKYYPEPQLFTRQHYLLPPQAVFKHNEAWNKITLTAESQSAKEEAIHQYRSQLRNPFLKPLFIGFMRNNELLVSRDIQDVEQI